MRPDWRLAGDEQKRTPRLNLIWIKGLDGAWVRFVEWLGVCYTLYNMRESPEWAIGL